MTVLKIHEVVPMKTPVFVSAVASISTLTPKSITFTPSVCGAGAMLPTIGTLNFFACSINNAGFFRPALNPTTRNLFGLAATI